MTDPFLHRARQLQTELRELPARFRGSDRRQQIFESLVDAILDALDPPVASVAPSEEPLPDPPKPPGIRNTQNSASGTPPEALRIAQDARRELDTLFALFESENTRYGTSETLSAFSKIREKLERLVQVLQDAPPIPDPLLTWGRVVEAARAVARAVNGSDGAPSLEDAIAQLGCSLSEIDPTPAQLPSHGTACDIAATHHKPALDTARELMATRHKPAQEVAHCWTRSWDDPDLCEALGELEACFAAQLPLCKATPPEKAQTDETQLPPHKARPPKKPPPTETQLPSCKEATPKPDAEPLDRRSASARSADPPPCEAVVADPKLGDPSSQGGSLDDVELLRLQIDHDYTANGCGGKVFEIKGSNVVACNNPECGWRFVRLSFDEKATLPKVRP